MLMMVKSGKRNLSAKALYRLAVAESESGVPRPHEPTTIQITTSHDPEKIILVIEEALREISNLKGSQWLLAGTVEGYAKKLKELLAKKSEFANSLDELGVIDLPSRTTPVQIIGAIEKAIRLIRRAKNEEGWIYAAMIEGLAAKLKIFYQRNSRIQSPRTSK